MTVVGIRSVGKGGTAAGGNGDGISQPPVSRSDGGITIVGGIGREDVVAAGRVTRVSWVLMDDVLIGVPSMITVTHPDNARLIVKQA